MALELVGGALLSAFLQVAFDKLASPQILDFFHARELDQKLLNKLETKMHSIHSLADDAERKQFTDPHVRNWLLKVKDAVLNAEDLLDDIQKISKRQDAESESQTSGCTCKVLNFFKSSPITISSLNKEIECRMEQILDDLEFLSTQRGDLGLKIAGGVGSGLSNDLSQKSQTTSLVVGTDIYGRDDDKRLIIDWLTSDINCDEFDVFKISRAILEAVTKSTDDSRDLEMVHRRMKEELTGKKFLLVLDDVWNENQPKWEEVQKPLVLGVQGSKILVTTRSKEVASTMRSEEYSLQQLQEDDCWKLFAKHAFRGDCTQLNPECKKIGMKIVKKCKGLPLALKTMGSMLYNKSSVSEWKTVLQSEIWEFSKERCDIIPALALSYIHLPSHLKVCFAYCALFPKDYELEKKELIQLWMTENFAHCHQHSRTPEEVCQQYFNDLLSRSFFQQPNENKEVFIMHDLLHDLAKYVGGGLYFRCELDQTEKIQEVARHISFEFQHKQYFDGFGTLCNTKRLRTFMPNASSLNYLWSWDIKMSIDELFSKFKFIRILSLSHCSDLQELPDSFGNLEYLRSLDLSHTMIKRLTEKICSLSHLQILNLNYCIHLEELPSNLHLLSNLCRLELKETKVRKVPPHLGKLKNLKVVMNSFNVGLSKELGIQQLREINLDGSISIGELQNIEDSTEALEADLKNKTHLVELSLGWGRNGNSIDSKKEEDTIENLQPSKNLRKLSIFKYGGKQFPNWLLDKSFLNLVFLELDKCESCQRLPPLGLLPYLKRLKISGFDKIVSVDGDFHGNNSCSFKSLEILDFSHMSQWEKWDCQVVIGAFPRLIRLFISNLLDECEFCERLPPLGLLPFLKVLKIIKLDGVVSIVDGDFHGNNISSFKSLETLHFSYMRQWEKWDCQADAFPRLRDLSIRKCPKLKGQLPKQLIPLEKLQIKDCQQLEAFAPRALDLQLRNCGKLQLECGTMKRLTMETSLFEIVGLYDTLEDLYIDSPLESINDGCISLRSFPLDLFPKLKTLALSGFDNLEMISQSFVHNHLEHLKLEYCLKFESLPGSMHMLLPSLRSLSIRDCPRLESFPDGGLPSNLEELEISKCSRLVGSLKGAFRDSPSLKILEIDEVDAKCFPDKGLLPLSLTFLIISHCPNLEKLDYKGLHLGLFE
ncbi:hypothetical protein PHAVU_011G200840 [Phaseolus vulgaris]|uniref:Disease resistance RPP13-like protein 1 n=1 Tax=Phaseolus vulgaris TaxID=3885 RepID=V7AK58_PHAVU|nr:hypothetical protein PHAVU_010G004700g [Phaseolus vulgaris]ESW05929.1 hypothetical protein PHAVU_010G004700g [Phaseolus vulgaris]